VIDRIELERLLSLLSERNAIFAASAAFADHKKRHAAMRVGFEARKGKGGGKGRKQIRPTIEAKKWNVNGNFQWVVIHLS